MKYTASFENSCGFKHIEVTVNQVQDDGTIIPVGSYTRNYGAFYNTFFPFQQGDQWYALYSKDYETTSVMELPSCKHLADTEEGFCPVEFYVPTPADIPDYDESENYTLQGTFGFAAGCVWGDDSGGWKCEFLDLSRIKEGIVTMDGRLGYFELANRPLKDCISWNLYQESGRISVDTQIHLHTGMHSYIPDIIEHTQAGEEGFNVQEEAVKSIPHEILLKQVALIRKQYFDTACSFHNFKAFIARKMDPAEFDKLVKEAEEWKTQNSEAMKANLADTFESKPRSLRCRHCDRSIDILECQARYTSLSSVIFVCPECGNTSESKIFE